MADPKKIKPTTKSKVSAAGRTKTARGSSQPARGSDAQKPGGRAKTAAKKAVPKKTDAEAPKKRKAQPRVPKKKAAPGRPAEISAVAAASAAGTEQEVAAPSGEGTAAPAGGLLGKLKHGVAEAYKAGSRVVDEFSHSARDYTERIKVEADIKDLGEQRDRLATELGRSVYAHHRGTGQLPASFFKAKEAGALLMQLEKVEKLIGVMQKQLRAMKQ